jgi:UDP-N-acetylmuramoyl-L-alanyl-D-glutamate--2,6-diaminopimelate ligase
MKTLSQLLQSLPNRVEVPSSDLHITGIVHDSRKLEPGNLFVALKGGNFDGHRFIPDAVKAGAAAVVGSESGIQLVIPYIRIDNSRQALAYLSAAFYDHPGRKLQVVGVTGTDGKTTTCNLLYQVLLAAGIKAGMISTVNAVIGEEVMDTGFHVTTPDAPDVQRYLAKMVAAGLTHVVLETTSHGWAQYRVDACEIDVGVVTNITHEHLDEHGSFEAYRAAKARLFESLVLTKPKAQGNPRLAVLNYDDSSFAFLSTISPIRFVSYGLTSAADVYADAIKIQPEEIRFSAVSHNWKVLVKTSLVGAYNISNCLAALTAVTFGLGIDPHLASRGIANLRGIPGRMEFIDFGQDFDAIVDFAHTPNALKNTIESARQISNGRVIVIFGSAGLRDKEKRRMMAEIASEMADLAILTAEDPRTESLDEILAEMVIGAKSKAGVEGKTFWRVPDRGEAIRFGISLAEPGDVVMACGKGHEQSMCFGEIEYPWDDRIAMKAALAEYLGLDGYEMPRLPTSDLAR